MNKPEAHEYKPLNIGKTSSFFLGVLIIVGIVLITFAAVPRMRGKAEETITLGMKFYKTTFGSEDIPSTKPLETVRTYPASGTLRVDPTNPRYFMDGSGRTILLVGSHTWDNRQDQGTGDFDWIGYLNDLESWGHNFFRLWVWEQPKGITTSPDPVNPNTTLTPGIWLRSGPGIANDGGPKFDLTQYNSDHFERLRQRVIEAGDHGLYVSIMLFNGWSVAQKGGGTNPWTYHPFNKDNNINGINGDTNGDNSGYETEDLSIQAITDLQEAYVAHVVDTLNDLDNVLYEICNESDVDVEWQNHMIDYIQTYEASKQKQHPVGFTATSNPNSTLFASDAEWISPNGGDGYFSDPPASDGSKVVVLDNDHIFGIGGDRSWYWKGFMRGLNLLYMDAWDGHFLYGVGDQNVRDNLGWIRDYANRIDLRVMEPHGELTSSGYALANPAVSGAEYLIYLPEGSAATNILNYLGIDKSPDMYLPMDSHVTVNLSATQGELKVEWFNPDNGTTTDGGQITGGEEVSFSAPFGGDAVLYLYQEKIPREINRIYIPVVVYPVKFQ